MRRRIQTAKSSRSLVPDRGSLIKSPQIQSRAQSPAPGPSTLSSRPLSKYSGKQPQSRKASENREDNPLEIKNLRRSYMLQANLMHGGNSKIFEEYSHLIVDDDMRLFFDQVKYMNRRV